MPCSCSSDKYEKPRVEEKSLFLNNCKLESISITQCPYCLGRLDGRVAGRISYLPTHGQDEERNQTDDMTFDHAYQEGFEQGLGEAFTLIESPLDSLTNDSGTFTVGVSEFGETYHVAAAMLTNDNFCANLDDASQDQIVFFTNIFNPSRCYFKKVVNKIDKNSSTGFFAKLFQQNKPTTEVYNNIFKALTRNLIYRGGNEDNDQQEANDTEELMQKFVTYLQSLRMVETEKPKVIIWIRNKADESSFRNTQTQILQQILEEISARSIEEVILMGDQLDRAQQSTLDDFKDLMFFYDLTEFSNRPGFKLIIRDHQIAGQLFFIKTLQEKFNVLFSVGMMSGAMDGPAFIGMPTIILTNCSKNSRIPAAGRIINTMICVHYESDTLEFESPQSLSEAIDTALELIDYHPVATDTFHL